jgi:hypothetical protein
MHWKQHGGDGAFLFSRCVRDVPGGLRATKVYVFPKYKLDRARCTPTAKLCNSNTCTCHEDMRRMLKLVTATSVSTIRASCACPDQGTYHLKLHVRLRQMYTAVWWCENGQAVDAQRLYQR